MLFSLTMSRIPSNLIVYPTEKFRDKIDRGHEFGSSLVAWLLQEIVAILMTFFKLAPKVIYLPIILSGICVICAASACCLLNYVSPAYFMSRRAMIFSSYPRTLACATSRSATLNVLMHT